MASNPNSDAKPNEPVNTDAPVGGDQAVDAKKEAEKVLADAQAEAKKVVEDAKAEAEKVKSDADEAAKKTKADAEKAATKAKPAAKDGEKQDLGEDVEIELSNRMSTNNVVYGPGKVTVPKLVADDLLRRDKEATSYQLDLHRERNFANEAEAARKNGTSSNEQTV